MNETENPEQTVEVETKFLDWVARNYGQDVRDQCLRVLEEPGRNRVVSAEVLEEAFYRIHKQDIDDALTLGEHCFTSD